MQDQIILRVVDQQQSLSLLNFLLMINSITTVLSHSDSEMLRFVGRKLSIYATLSRCL